MRMIDVFLNQGAVLLDSTECRRKLPTDHPHYLNVYGYKRHPESQNHPHNRDIKNANINLFTILPRKKAINTEQIDTNTYPINSPLHCLSATFFP